MKSYPLDVWYFEGWLCSKGHHAPGAFTAAVLEGWGEEIRQETFRHRWARWGPVPGERDMGLVYTDGPGRGAFPITEAEVVK